MSVTRLVDVIKRVRAVERILAADFKCSTSEVLRRRNGQQREHHVEHRNVNVLALACALARHQRREDGKRRDHAAGQVGDLHAGDHRRAALVGRQSQDARQRQVIHIVTAAVAVRPRLPEACQRAVDDARVHLLDRLIADAQAVNDARSKLFENDIGGGGEFEKDGAARVLFEVERNRLLVAIDLQECGAVIAEARQAVTRRVARAASSTLMTSAPRSPSIIEANGPGSSRERSSTRNPESAWCMMT